MVRRAAEHPVNPNRNLFLVTGATGHQGHRLATLLLQRGHRVRAFTRHVDQPAAVDLAERGAEVFEGDFEDRESLRRAAEGVNAAFMMATPYEAGVEAEVREGKKEVEAMKQAGVPFLLYSSVASADRDTGIPHFDSKRAVERHLMSLGIPHAIVGPVFFMENLLAPDMMEGLADGRLEMPLPSDRPLQMVALSDLAEFFARVLEQPDRFRGRRLDVASDEVTPERAARVLSRVSGRPVEHVRTSLDGMRAKSADLGAMWSWFDRVGYNVDIAALHREYAGISWLRFEEWAELQDWSRVTAASRQQPAR